MNQREALAREGTEGSSLVGQASNRRGVEVAEQHQERAVLPVAARPPARVRHGGRQLLQPLLPRQLPLPLPGLLHLHALLCLFRQLLLRRVLGLRPGLLLCRALPAALSAIATEPSANPATPREWRIGHKAA